MQRTPGQLSDIERVCYGIKDYFHSSWLNIEVKPGEHASVSSRLAELTIWVELHDKKADPIRIETSDYLMGVEVSEDTCYEAGQAFAKRTAQKFLADLLNH